jgi:hypothetical protein
MKLSRITLMTKTMITWHGVQRSVKHTFHFDIFSKNLFFPPIFFLTFWHHPQDSISISNTHTLIHSFHAFNQCILGSTFLVTSGNVMSLIKYPQHLWSVETKLQSFNIQYSIPSSSISLTLGFQNFFQHCQ